MDLLGGYDSSSSDDTAAAAPAPPPPVTKPPPPARPKLPSVGALFSSDQASSIRAGASGSTFVVPASTAASAAAAAAAAAAPTAADKRAEAVQKLATTKQLVPRQSAKGVRNEVTEDTSSFTRKRKAAAAAAEAEAAAATPAKAKGGSGKGKGGSNKGSQFNKVESQKRQRGQVANGGSTVQEEKRLLRQFEKGGG